MKKLKKILTKNVKYKNYTWFINLCVYQDDDFQLLNEIQIHVSHYTCLCERLDVDPKK